MTTNEKNCKIAKALGWLQRTNAEADTFDPYHSEEASAMLLEAMPLPYLHRLSDKQWIASYGNTDAYQRKDKDRKTAIADAFLALLDSGWRPGR